jgi:flagellar basal body-associated protein FliL
MAEIKDIEEVSEEESGDTKSKLIEFGIYGTSALVFLIIAYFLVNSLYPGIYNFLNLEKLDNNVKTIDQPEVEYDLLMLKTVVNPKGSGANRFLMVETAINPLLDFSSEFDKMNPKLTSLTGEYFASKTVEELSEVKNRELFKRELAEQINRYTIAETGNNLVYELYFVQFIMQ